MVDKMQKSSTNRELGFSLVELMVAMTIGSILATALVVVFSNVMQTNREQFKAAQQIENGRYAIDLMTNDMRLAGYYGEFGTLPPAAAALPDPCEIPAAIKILETTANSPFGFHVQGYAPASLAARPSVPAGCSSKLNNNTLRPGSDIVVIRRLDTKPLLDVDNNTATVLAVGGEVYAQTSHSFMDIQYGSGSAINGTQKANGTNIPNSELTRKNFLLTTLPRLMSAPYIRKVHVHVYFVANCRDASNDGTCPDSNDGIPTLKRLELTTDGAGNRTMKVVPLVEGIEFLRVRYGLDTNSDASVDSLVPASSITTVANWQNVVMLELRVLARNSESTTGYTDDKTYNLGAATFTPSGNDTKYKRHVFTSQVYILNIGGRRES